MQLEAEAYRLGPDDVMRVGPAVRRQLVNAGEEPVVLLALGGSGEHEGRDGRASADWDEEAGSPAAGGSHAGPCPPRTDRYPATAGASVGSPVRAWPARARRPRAPAARGG